MFLANFIKTAITTYQGAPKWGGGGCRAAATQTPKAQIKKIYFVDIMISEVYVISPSAKISH
jgi:hypothetical protein